MWRWIKVGFPIQHRFPDTSIPIHGVRILAEGSAEGVLIVATPSGDRVFGGPMVDRTLTEYGSPESAELFPLPSECLVPGIPPRLDLPARIGCTAVTLRFRATTDEPYTIREFYPIRLDS